MKIRRCRPALLCLALAAAAAQASDLDACNAVVPTPPPAARPVAAAYWLDARTLQWPGLMLQAGERVRLHHAQAAGLRAAAGEAVGGGDGAVDLAPSTAAVPARLRFIGDGPRFAVAAGVDVAALLRAQMLLVHETADGRVIAATGVQTPGALDDLYAAAEHVGDLGAHPAQAGTRFAVWAPTAQRVLLCRHAAAGPAATAVDAMRLDAATGVWRAELPGDLSGQGYRYLVDVVTPTHGRVRNLVTDPYAVALTADSQLAVVADLASPSLKPRGWNASPRPTRVEAATDQVIYELHVRDFSIGDATVRPAWRGKYLAFTEGASDGMRHLKALARAGLTDVHLLPVFDLASVPERGCRTPTVPKTAPDSDAQQAAVMAIAADDCFNWGYDPWHFNAPEGSFSSFATHPLTRVVEFRQMVMGLHRAGLRVGMDMVYNHTAASGQHPKSVLDRLVPGYYHRLNAQGEVERSTCCDNTATEHRMMAKLMIDSAALWVREYRIDSMRFDLMGHQPREAMERLQRRVDAEAGRPVQLLGEGWNFGEVADGARFVQASQLSLNGSGIGSFSDRARDAARGGSAGEGGDDSVRRQGWLNGLVYAPNALAAAAPASPQELLAAADLIRVGLAGSLRGFELTTWTGEKKRLAQIDYAGQPAGFASEPGEVVNYTENHDNQTLFDVNALKLPLATGREDRARVQMLGAGRLQPGHRLLPCRPGHPAQQEPGPQQLRQRRLVQPARLDLPHQPLRHRPAAEAGQLRQGRPRLGAGPRAAGAHGHRPEPCRDHLGARRLPRPAEDPRQHAAAAAVERGGDQATRQLPRQRCGAEPGAGRDAHRWPRAGGLQGGDDADQRGAHGADPGLAWGSKRPLAPAPCAAPGRRCPREAGGALPGRQLRGAGPQRRRLCAGLTRVLGAELQAVALEQPLHAAIGQQRLVGLLQPGLLRVGDAALGGQPDACGLQRQAGLQLCRVAAAAPPHVGVGQLAAVEGVDQAALQRVLHVADAGGLVDAAELHALLLELVEVGRAAQAGDAQTPRLFDAVDAWMVGQRDEAEALRIDLHQPLELRLAVGRAVERHDEGARLVAGQQHCAGPGEELRLRRQPGPLEHGLHQVQQHAALTGFAGHGHRRQVAGDQRQRCGGRLG